MNNIIKYSLSGIINTITGYTLFLIFFYILSAPIEISNFISFLITICIGYFLQKNYVFKNMNSNGFKAFIYCTIAAYAINFTFLKISILIGFKPYLSQIISMVFYSVSHFVLLRLYVFNIKEY